MRKINKRSETAIYIVSLMMAFLGEVAERTAVILRNAPVSKIIDEKDLLNLNIWALLLGICPRGRYPALFVIKLVEIDYIKY